MTSSPGGDGVTAAADVGSTAPLHIQLLGVVTVRHADGEELGLAPAERRLLECLGFARPGDVTFDELVDTLWGTEPPRNARQSLHNHLARLRRKLGDESLVRTGGGYRLVLGTDVDQLDELWSRLVDLDTARHAADAGGARSELVLTLTAEARDRLGATTLAGPDRLPAQLVDRSHEIERMRVRALISLGRATDAVTTARDLVAADTHDESSWVILVDALAAAGRRGEALAAFARARRTLASELGIEPGTELGAAERRVLDVGDGAGATSLPLALAPSRQRLARTIAERVRMTRGVAILGEAGLGKTALAHAVVATLRRAGAHTVAVSCSPHPATPLEPISDLLDEIDAQHRLHRGGLAEGAVAIAGVVADALTARADGRLLVIFFDDLHEAAPSTLAVLADCLERMADLRLVITSHDGPNDAPLLADLESVVIPALDEDDLAALVRDSLGSGRDTVAVVDWLAATTAGNPLFASELLSDALRKRALEVVDGAWVVAADLTAPEVLGAVLRRRLDDLSSGARRALDDAAVAGSAVSVELLTARGLAAATDECVASGVLRRTGDNTLTFTHGLVRQFVYDSIPTGRRIEAHHAIASHAENSAMAPAIVAHHRLAAVELAPKHAVDAAHAAGADAATLGAFTEAMDWYERAEEASKLVVDDRARDRLGLRTAIRRGDVRRLLGDPGHDVELLEVAGAAIDDGDLDLIAEATVAVLQLGGTSRAGGVDDAVVTVADRALDLLAQHDSWPAVAASYSGVLGMAGDPQRCANLYDAAEERAVSDADLAVVLPFAYLAVGRADQLPRRAAIAARLITVADRLDDPTTHFEARHLQFSCAMQTADGHLLRQSHREMEALISRTGSTGRRWALAYQRAAIAHLDDDLEAAEDHAEVALAIFGGVSPSRALAAYGAQLLMIRFAQGRIDELAPTFTDLARDQPGVPAWHAAAALALCETDPTAARRHLRELLANPLTDFAWLAGRVTAARAAAIVGDVDAARQLSAELAPYGDVVCWQGTCSFGPVALALAGLAPVVELDAVDRHTQALALSESLGAAVFTRECVEMNA